MMEFEAEPDHAKAENRPKKSYLTICMLYVVYSLSFSMIIPALPGLILSIVNNNDVLSSIYYGQVSALRNLLEFFSDPVLGTISDIRGRKPVLTLSFAVCAFEFLLLGLVPSVPMVFISRAISGLGDVGVATSFAIITDIATFNGDVVTQKYGLVGAMFGLAFIVGPVTGGLLSSYSFPLCFLAAACVAGAAAIMAHHMLEETLHINDDHRTGSNGSAHSSSQGTEAGKDTVLSFTLIRNALNSSMRSIRVHLADVRMKHYTVVLVLNNLAGGYYPIWFLYMDYRFHASTSTIGVYLSYIGIVHAFVLGILIHKITPAIWSETKAAFYTIILAAFHAFAIIFATEVWHLYVLSFVFAIQSIYNPSLRAVIVKESLRRHDTEKIQGNLQGVLSSIQTLATAAAALIYSGLFSLSVDWLADPILVFLFSGAMHLISAVYFYIVLLDGNLQQHEDHFDDDDLVKDELEAEARQSLITKKSGYGGASADNVEM